MLAVVLRKFEFAICAMAWSFVTFIQPAKASIVPWMVRMSVFASVRKHTSLTPNGLTSTARSAPSPSPVEPAARQRFQND